MNSEMLSILNPTYLNYNPVKMITVRLCVICGCEMWMTFFQINRKYIVQKIVTLQLSVDILSNLLKIVRCK